MELKSGCIQTTEFTWVHKEYLNFCDQCYSLPLWSVVLKSQRAIYAYAREKHLAALFLAWLCAEAPGTTSLVFICSVNILLKTAEVSVSFVYVNKQHE